jgi:hypothetical protein
MTIFKNGNLFPPDGELPSWGASGDHIFIYPPKDMEYWRIAFKSSEQFNLIFEKLVGFKQ